MIAGFSHRAIIGATDRRQGLNGGRACTGVDSAIHNEMEHAARFATQRRDGNQCLPRADDVVDADADADAE